MHAIALYSHGLHIQLFQFIGYSEDILFTHDSNHRMKYDISLARAVATTSHLGLVMVLPPSSQFKNKSFKLKLLTTELSNTGPSIPSIFQENRNIDLSCPNYLFILATKAVSKITEQPLGSYQEKDYIEQIDSYNKRFQFTDNKLI